MSTVSADSLALRELGVLKRLAQSEHEGREIAKRAAVAMTAQESAAHLLDLRRTRVEPLADPRASWSGARDVAEVRALLKNTHVCIVECRPRGAQPHLSLASRSDRWKWEGPERAYVPQDVCRWRDPEHRAALTARARERAAIKPWVYR